MIPEFTTVVGVDAKHLRQLAQVWPTWRKWKPDIIRNPMVIFYEREQVTPAQVHAVCDHPRLLIHAWPPEGVVFTGDNTSKWENQQRHKMLAGYVYIPAMTVKTKYWLKLDTDVIATGLPDWIDPAWFDKEPAIISHPWGFTRPGDQMLKLDAWVEKHYERLSVFQGTKPLNLRPRPGEDRVCHRRIGSWCAFFRTDFNHLCAEAASHSVGVCQIPVPSQDGFTFYVATRLGLGVVRTSMKRRGWTVFNTESNIIRTVQEAMKENEENGPTSTT